MTVVKPSVCSMQGTARTTAEMYHEASLNSGDHTYMKCKEIFSETRSIVRGIGDAAETWRGSLGFAFVVRRTRGPRVQ